MSANETSSQNGSSKSELTLAMIGCGNMGIAILSGILTSLKELHASSSVKENTPSQLPTRFVACVKREASVARVSAALSDCYLGAELDVYRENNVYAVEHSDIVILGCKPYMVKDILSQKGMCEALAGKLLISICAGVTTEHLWEMLYGDGSHHLSNNPCTIVRAMPSTASLVRQSMTVIGISDPPLPEEKRDLITWIFKQIGDVVYLPPHLMDVSTALCGSGPAFFALVLEAATDGAVAMGVPRAEAQKMAAQTMRGTADLVLNGEHPAVLKDKVSTPGGCTIGGLLVLEEGAVRGTVAKAIREATVVASQLGQGAKNVNGTRH